MDTDELSRAPRETNADESKSLSLWHHVYCFRRLISDHKGANHFRTLLCWPLVRDCSSRNAGFGNVSSICSSRRPSSLLDAVAPALLHLHDSQEAVSHPKRRQMVIRFQVCWNGTKSGVCRSQLPILSE